MSQLSSSSLLLNIPLFSIGESLHKLADDEGRFK
jgi:hypothetical protein